MSVKPRYLRKPRIGDKVDDNTIHGGTGKVWGIIMDLIDNIKYVEVYFPNTDNIVRYEYDLFFGKNAQFGKWKRFTKRWLFENNSNLNISSSKLMSDLFKYEDKED